MWIRLFDQKFTMHEKDKLMSAPCSIAVKNIWIKF